MSIIDKKSQSKQSTFNVFRKRYFISSLGGKVEIWSFTFFEDEFIDNTPILFVDLLK